MASIHVGTTKLEREVIEEELQAALWEIVRAVALFTGTYCNDSDASKQCPYCLAFQPQKEWLIEKKPFPHEDDCIVTKARKLAEKGIQANL